MSLTCGQHMDRMDPTMGLFLLVRTNLGPHGGSPRPPLLIRQCQYTMVLPFCQPNNNPTGSLCSFRNG